MLNSASAFYAAVTALHTAIKGDLETLGSSGTTVHSIDVSSRADMKQDKLLTKERDRSLDQTIAEIRQLLGKESAEKFELYLIQKFLPIKQDSQQTATPNALAPTPFRSSSIKAKGVQGAKDTTTGQAVSHETVDIGEPQVCQDYIVDNGEGEDDGSFTLCAYAQLSYLGPPSLVEQYVDMYASWDNVAEYHYGVAAHLR